MIKKLALGLLSFYRKYLSHTKLQCCRFYPSCSEYTGDAIEKYGVLKGSAKGIGRLLRCSPLSRGGYDPV